MRERERPGGIQRILMRSRQIEEAEQRAAAKKPSVQEAPWLYYGSPWRYEQALLTAPKPPSLLEQYPELGYEIRPYVPGKEPTPIKLRPPTEQELKPVSRQIGEFMQAKLGPRKEVAHLLPETHLRKGEPTTTGIVTGTVAGVEALWRPDVPTLWSAVTPRGRAELKRWEQEFPGYKSGLFLSEIVQAYVIGKVGGKVWREIVVPSRPYHAIRYSKPMLELEYKLAGVKAKVLGPYWGKKTVARQLQYLFPKRTYAGLEPQVVQWFGGYISGKPSLFAMKGFSVQQVLTKYVTRKPAGEVVLRQIRYGPSGIPELVSKTYKPSLLPVAKEYESFLKQYVKPSVPWITISKKEPSVGRWIIKTGKYVGGKKTLFETTYRQFLEAPKRKEAFEISLRKTKEIAFLKEIEKSTFGKVTPRVRPKIEPKIMPTPMRLLKEPTKLKLPDLVKYAGKPYPFLKMPELVRFKPITKEKKKERRKAAAWPKLEIVSKQRERQIAKQFEKATQLPRQFERQLVGQKQALKLKQIQKATVPKIFKPPPQKLGRIPPTIPPTWKWPRRYEPSRRRGLLESLYGRWFMRKHPISTPEQIMDLVLGKKKRKRKRKRRKK